MSIDLYKAREIFVEAVGKDPAEQARLIAERCGDDAALRMHVENLLRADASAGGFLDQPAAMGLNTTIDQVPAECPGTVIGPYKLVELIGEGGMGAVYLAQQTEPVKRLVALKVIKAGMDSKQVLARFEAERQALALMDHPNIAKVLDAGATFTGRPFFVMELVKGVPITKFCDERKLTPRERLELFLPVCQAIQHAHQKGIIHRDIKPNNVLVALYDGRPVPKVIDFGVAKATGQSLTERTLVTGLGAVVGTPEYMSPEQAELNQLDIDTRSDVYSLGVLLYELLTGTTPLTRKRVKEAALLEILRVIREEEPQKPSTRLSTTDELPSIAANRATEPARLSRLMRGELDWIAMKALEKDRGRRYETANGLAADLQRYLADEPVLACPPSASYRLRKFARRNRVPVVAAGVILLCLLAGIIGTSAGLVWAVRERDDKARALEAVTKAREAERQAHDKGRAALRAVSDVAVENQMARGTQLTEENKEFLRRVIRLFEGFAAITADDAESRAIRAEGYFRVGRMRHHLGELKEAEAANASAVALQERLVADFPDRPEFRSDLAATLNNQGLVFRDKGRPTDAEAAIAAAVAHFRQLAADFPARAEFRRDLARSLSHLGIVFRDAGRAKDAEAAYAAALTLQKQLATDVPDQPEYRSERAASHNNLGNVFRDTGRAKDAEDAYAAAVALYKELVADYPTWSDFRQDLARSHNNLAHILDETDRAKDAEAAYARALVVYKQLAADYPSRPEVRADLARSHTNLGVLLRKTGRPTDAATAYAAALALQEPLAADFPDRPEFRRDLAATHSNLAALFHTTNRPTDAEPAYREALALQKPLAADFPDRPEFRAQLATIHYNLGTLLADTNRPTDAAAAFAEAIALQKPLAANYPAQPEHRVDLARSHYNLGMLLRTTNRLKDAEAAYTAAVALLQQLAADYPDRTEFRAQLAGVRNNLGNLFADTNRPTDAAAAYADALALQKQLAADFPDRPEFRAQLATTHYNLGRVLHAASRLKEAEGPFAAAVALQKQLAADFPDQPGFRSDLARSHFSLGRLYHGTDRLTEADAAYQDALALQKRLAADLPNQPDRGNSVAVTCGNLAMVRLRQRDFKAAKEFLDEAGRPHEAALKASPQHPHYRRVYRSNLTLMIQAHAGLGDRAAAKRAAEQLRDFGGNPAADAYDAACHLSLCIPIVRKGDRTTKEERDEQAAFYGDEAIKMLRAAVDKGFKDAAHLDKDGDLEPLCTRADFKELVAELKSKLKEPRVKKPVMEKKP